MKNIIIDEEFKGLLPELDKETYAMLEENLLQNGCRDSLVLWGDTLIDGHNRFEICTKHGIPYNTIDKEFETREDVIIWMVSTQISRRNLTPKQLSNYRGLHYLADKKIQGINNQYTLKSEKRHSDVFQKSTAVRLSEQYNVSSRTIDRDAKFAAALKAVGEISPEAKRLILTDKAKLDKKELMALLDRPKDEVVALAMAVEQGEYKKKKPGQAEPPDSDASAVSPAPNAPSGVARPIDPVLADIRLLKAALDKVSGAFYTALPEIKKKAERTELKTALKPCFDILTDLYMQL